MDDVIKLAKTYRITTALDQRHRLADELFAHLEPKMSMFVLSRVNPSSADDVLQEVLKAISTNLRQFSGRTNGEFWAWAYTIARHKIADYCRRRASDRLQPTADDELLQLIDTSITAPTLSPGAVSDLDRVLQLLAAAKPGCRALLWSYYVQGYDYAEIAAEKELTYDAARMKIGRCLEDARALVA